MVIKTKLRIGIAFLFLTAFLSAGLADYYLNRLSTDSKVILKDNYRSLIYTKNIGQLLDGASENLSSPSTQQAIQDNIDKEKHNITETGEEQLADSLQIVFESLKQNVNNPAASALLKSKMKNNLYGIIQLNMNAIERKNAIAIHTADRSIIIVSLAGTLCFLIAFSFAVNFPSYIANPIKKDITQLKKISEDKTTFIATVSHELKTPISAIKMSLKLLRDDRVGTMNTEQQQLIDDIDYETQRLLQITGELLHSAQAEAGNIQLNFGSAHPQNIVDYAVRAVKSLADQKEVSIAITCPETLPNVIADLDKTTWVLINLLSNAIKYSPQKSAIDLTVTKRINMLEFSVKDNGQGIDVQYLSRIFERYFKVPGADAEQTGTGLGLAIAKDFIEAQGGIIGVESTVGNGSRFYFSLSTNNIPHTLKRAL